jgi:guanine deaminase
MTVLRARVLTPDPDAEAPAILDGAGPEALRWLDDALVVIDPDGRIREVGPPDGRAVDADLRPGVLLPGFVDGHIHLPQTRIVGSASGPLLRWLARSTFPEERRFADADHARTVAHHFAALLAASGTTFALVYGSRHAEAADAGLQALADRGLRGRVGPVWMDVDCPPELAIPPERSEEDVRWLVERWQGHDDRLEVAVLPRFAPTSSAEGLARAGALSRELGLWASTHLAENPDECAHVRERFGRDYLRVYEDAGLVHDRSVLAHCIHLDPDDWDRFAAARAVVAHCPDSNAFLGSGHMPTGAVLSRGIPLCIGTDVAAGRSFRIPRILSSAYDNALAAGHPVAPATLLRWGTLDGARALGLTGVGAIHPGFEADLVLLDLPEWVEDAEGVLAWSLFWADAPLPRRTWVRGRVVWDRDTWGLQGTPFPWQGSVGPT